MQDDRQEPTVDLSTGIDGQVMAVVGGAGGIGKATALRLAAGGARVAVLDLDEKLAKDVADELPDATAIGVDVRDPQSVSEAMRRVEAWAGQLHGLVNCAGVTGVTGKPSHEIEPADFANVVRINLEGAFLLSRAVLPGMVSNGYGRVLHLASIAGKDGNAGMVSYSASKAGLIGMVKAQGKEYATQGVTVNALAPAVIHTSMVDAMPDEQVDYMTSRIPMARLGRLEECAELIAWIVSPASSFTTGFTFDLSGGRAVY